MYHQKTLVIVLLFLFGWTYPVMAAISPPPQNPTGPKMRAGSVLVLDENGVELAAKNADLVRPIASLTKLMTAMVLLDAGLDFSAVVTYDPKKHYAYKNYLHIKKGERFRAEDLWYEMLVGSLNIETRMIVAATGIPELTFIDRMNIKASVLGLENTTFVNTTGLPSDVPGGSKKGENTSTAREIAQLFYEATKYPRIADALARSSYQFTEVLDKDKKLTHFFHNTNNLLKEARPYRIVATKTGYSEQAGACIIMQTASRAGNFTIVSLGDPNYYQRFDEPERLAEWALMRKWVSAAGR